MSILKSPLIIVSDFSFPNFDRMGANSSIKVAILKSLLFNFGGLYNVSNRDMFT